MKAYLSERGIDYVDHDLTRDPEAVRELVSTYHSRSTPTIVIRDTVIIGFDRERLDQIL